MSLNITIAPKYESEHDFIASLPQVFDSGERLYDGRNKVRLFVRGGKRYVVKRFHKLSFPKNIIYTFFRKNKARRAYENALRLISKGVATPEPIALIEERNAGLLSAVYFVSGYTDWQAIRHPLTEEAPFNRQMTVDYARFVASLHMKGIIHKDLNNTNVLYHDNGGHYDFMLIDINRMTFTPDGSPARDEDCLENLTLFADRGEMFDFFASEYVSDRGWNASRVADVFAAKAKHDRHWHRKQAFKSKLRKLHL